MALQRLLCPLFIFIIFFSIPPCHYCLQEDPLFYNYIEEETGYDSQAYPSPISTIKDGMFSDLFKLRSDDLSLKSFDKVGNMFSSAKVFSVDDFGAKGGDDDTQAFEKAWQKACSTGGGVFVVPKNTYLLKPITFSGPCKSNTTVQIYGTIEASDDRSDYKEDGRHWITFENIQNMLIAGGGTIDGQGNIWWQNSCKIDKSKPCKDAPTAVTFYKCKNLVVRNLKIQNAQQIHVSFQSCKNVVVSNLLVTSPEHSPNTDGIHVTGTQDIQISNSVIGTGDDCISIVSGSQNVQAMGITCGPGHGISIGSLGSKNSRAYVSGVTVDGAKITGTTNGVRIKTWQGGSGSANNIKFQNIEMKNVTNPILIDQNYCDQHKPCKEQKSAVQVSNVVYKKIKGTSASGVAVKFECSKAYPCQGIVLEDINLEREEGEAAKAFCNNVMYAQLGVVSPHCPTIENKN